MTTKDCIGHFIASTALHILFPLIPLVYEFFQTEAITHNSFVLCASMYSFTSGFSTRHMWMLGVCELLGFFMLAAYGTKDPNSFAELSYTNWIVICLGCVMLMNFIEKFRIHVIAKEPIFSNNDK